MNAGLSRFVGFAFANADLLIEIDPAGRIAFAAGAAEALSGSPDEQLVGRTWAEFIDTAPATGAVIQMRRGHEKP